MRRRAALRQALALLRDPERRRIERDVLLLERVWRRPLVFEDSRSLRYVLYAGENARVYFEHGGNYEVDETAFCEQLLAPGDVVFDVGANIGLYALLCSRLVGPTGAVHAFEPEPENHRRLVVNLALNACENVVANRLGVFSHSGTEALNVYRPELGSWHTFGRPVLTDPLRDNAPAEPEATLEVSTVSLDDYASSHAVERVDLLKIDVEGAEVDVLEGARRLLDEGRIGVVLYEVSLAQTEGMGHTATAAGDLLATHGYRTFSLPGLEESAGPAARYGNYVAARDRDQLRRAR
jgi:FkbM family methyltransferase